MGARNMVLVVVLALLVACGSAAAQGDAREADARRDTYGSADKPANVTRFSARGRGVAISNNGVGREIG